MIVYYDDIYVPEIAAEVLELAGEVDEETSALAITCIAYCVECQLSRN